MQILHSVICIYKNLRAIYMYVCVYKQLLNIYAILIHCILNDIQTKHEYGTQNRPINRSIEILPAFGF